MVDGRGTSEAGASEEEAEGQLVLEEVNGWGEYESDKYKPPHIKALDDQANSEVAG